MIRGHDMSRQVVSGLQRLGAVSDSLDASDAGEALPRIRSSATGRANEPSSRFSGGAVSDASPAYGVTERNKRVHADAKAFADES